MKALLLNAVFALVIVLGALAVYDRIVVQPLRLVGVVDVGDGRAQHRRPQHQDPRGR